jgi:hypothetical protein
LALEDSTILASHVQAQSLHLLSDLFILIKSLAHAEAPIWDHMASIAHSCGGMAGFDRSQC